MKQSNFNDSYIIMSPHQFSARSALFILFIVLFSACGTFKEEKTYSKNGLTITYRSLSRFGSEIQNYRVQHPINVSVELVNTHLLSLWHRQIDPPGRPKPVFSQKDAEDLSPLLTKAFQKIKSNKYLHFEYKSPKGWTEGDVFSSTDKIHWRLLKINGEVYSNDPLKLRKRTWKLVRTPGQKFQIIKTDIDQKPLENWVVSDFQLPEPNLKDRFNSSSDSPPKPSREDISRKPELRNKLKILRELFEDGLINEKDYQNKKERLLNQHL